MRGEAAEMDELGVSNPAPAGVLLAGEHKPYPR